MNRRGAVLIGVLLDALVDVLFGVLVECHCGGGEDTGLLLRNDSGVVARSSSVFSRSMYSITFVHVYTILLY